MTKNLKLLFAAAALVLAAAPNVAAQGSTVSAELYVGPGERRCLDNTTKARSNASVNDYVISGEQVKFVFLGRPENSTGFWEISSSQGPVLAYSDYLNAPSERSLASFIPPLFPGFFRTCARNDSTRPSTVFLSVTVDR